MADDCGSRVAAPHPSPSSSGGRGSDGRGRPNQRLGEEREGGAGGEGGAPRGAVSSGRARSRAPSMPCLDGGADDRPSKERAPWGAPPSPPAPPGVIRELGIQDTRRAVRPPRGQPGVGGARGVQEAVAHEGVGLDHLGQGRALDLPARRLGDGLRPDEEHARGPEPASLADGLDDVAGDAGELRGAGTAVSRTSATTWSRWVPVALALDAHRGRVPDRRRGCRRPPRCRRGRRSAAHDDQVLDPPGDEEVALARRGNPGRRCGATRPRRAGAVASGSR